ncbi:hypothetical protein Tco_1155475 [Tanacetum coccineum]|uniref:Uncharacterized protein n=1 Tax=Tanacetum coccineum TaxID=301880 RepID=A0ABQ5BNA4_9ASTR
MSRLTKDTMPPANNGTPKTSKPPVVQIQLVIPNPEPLNVLRSYLSFEISFKTDAIDLMPKFCYDFKNLDWKHGKIKTNGKDSYNENCFRRSILNKLPKKLGDPGLFLIPILSLPENLDTDLHDARAYRSFKSLNRFVLLKIYPFELQGSHHIQRTKLSKYTADYNHMTSNKIERHDMACDEYSQEYTDHVSIKVSHFAKKDAKANSCGGSYCSKSRTLISRQKSRKFLPCSHLSTRLENPHQDKFENKEINEAFPLETLGSIALKDDSTPSGFPILQITSGKFVYQGN